MRPAAWSPALEVVVVFNSGNYGNFGTWGKFLEEWVPKYVIASAL
jgi:hypothetical protein